MAISYKKKELDTGDVDAPVEADVAPVDIPVAVVVAPVLAEVENRAPAKVYKNFDEFFMQYAIFHSIDKKWKKSVMLHLETINCLKDPAKWLDGIKHFGL